MVLESCLSFPSFFSFIQQIFIRTVLHAGNLCARLWVHKWQQIQSSTECTIELMRENLYHLHCSISEVSLPFTLNAVFTCKTDDMWLLFSCPKWLQASFSWEALGNPDTLTAAEKHGHGWRETLGLFSISSCVRSFQQDFLFWFRITSKNIRSPILQDKCKNMVKHSQILIMNYPPCLPSKLY